MTHLLLRLLLLYGGLLVSSPPARTTSAAAATKTVPPVTGATVAETTTRPHPDAVGTLLFPVARQRSEWSWPAGGYQRTTGNGGRTTTTTAAAAVAASSDLAISQHVTPPATSTTTAVMGTAQVAGMVLRYRGHLPTAGVRWVAGVLSTPDAADQRQWVRAFLGTYMHVVFLVEAGAGHALLREAQKHQDLLFFDIPATYSGQNSSLVKKVLGFFRAVLVHCPGTRFVVKTDHDSAFDVFRLQEEAESLPSPVYLGKIWGGGTTSLPAQTVHRNPASKHYIPRHVYARDTFHPYAAGCGYALDTVAMQLILELAALPQTVLPAEDTWVGKLAELAGITPRHGQYMLLADIIRPRIPTQRNMRSFYANLWEQPFLEDGISERTCRRGMLCPRQLNDIVTLLDGTEPYRRFKLLVPDRVEGHPDHKVFVQVKVGNHIREIATLISHKLFGERVLDVEDRIVAVIRDALLPSSLQLPVPAVSSLQPGVPAASQPRQTKTNSLKKTSCDLRRYAKRMCTLPEFPKGSDLIPMATVDTFQSCTSGIGEWHLILVWGHGLRHFKAIFDMIRDSLPSVWVASQTVVPIASMDKLVHAMYRKEMQTIGHQIWTQLQYLQDLPFDRVAVLTVFDPTPKWTTYGKHGTVWEIRANARLMELKQRIQESFNPKPQHNPDAERDIYGLYSHRHVMHVSDTQEDLAEKLHFLGQQDTQSFIDAFPRCWADDAAVTADPGKAPTPRVVHTVAPPPLAVLAPAMRPRAPAPPDSQGYTVEIVHLSSLRFPTGSSATASHAIKNAPLDLNEYPICITEPDGATRRSYVLVEAKVDEKEKEKGSPTSGQLRIVDGAHWVAAAAAHGVTRIEVIVLGGKARRNGIVPMPCIGSVDGVDYDQQTPALKVSQGLRTLTHCGIAFVVLKVSDPARFPTGVRWGDRVDLLVRGTALEAIECLRSVFTNVQVAELGPAHLRLLSSLQIGTFGFDVHGQLPLRKFRAHRLWKAELFDHSLPHLSPLGFQWRSPSPTDEAALRLHAWHDEVRGPTYSLQDLHWVAEHPGILFPLPQVNAGTSDEGYSTMRTHGQLQILDPFCARRSRTGGMSTGTAKVIPLQVLIFSKNRPMQLLVLLRSIAEHAIDWRQVDSITVIASATNADFVHGYILVQRSFPCVQFRWDMSPGLFHRQVLWALSPRQPEFTLTLVDDNVFLRPVAFADMTLAMRSYPLYSLSIRMHPGIVRSYTYGEDTPPPVALLSQPLAGGHVDKVVLVWDTCSADASGDWAYPESIASDVFRTRELRKVFQEISFKGPNAMEAEFVRYMTLYRQATKLSAVSGALGTRPVAIVVPHNQVQTASPGNKFSREGESLLRGISADEMNRILLSGEKILSVPDATDFEDVSFSATQGVLKTFRWVNVTISARRGHVLSEGAPTQASQPPISSLNMNFLNFLGAGDNNPKPFQETVCAKASSTVQHYFEALGLWGWAGSLYAYHGHDRIFARRVAELSTSVSIASLLRRVSVFTEGSWPQAAAYSVHARLALLLHSIFAINKARTALDMKVLRVVQTLLARLMELEQQWLRAVEKIAFQCIYLELQAAAGDLPSLLPKIKI